MLQRVIIGSLVLAIVGAVFLGATPAIADTLILSTGRELHGQVLSESEDAVVFEHRHRGLSAKITVSRGSIREIVKESAPSGPTYCRIPLIGPIGYEPSAPAYVTSDAFADALDAARKDGVDYVVLVIDSPGGEIAEMERIVELIRDAQDLKFVAQVQGKALSAAAVVTMACPQIYMGQNGVVGAAVPYVVGPDGTPENIQEKFRSAIRASCRVAVDHGRHSPLLLEGMMNTSIELSLIDREGRSEVVEGRADDGGRVLKRDGEILALTSAEAIETGLAAGLVDLHSELGELMGLESWHETSQQAWHVIEKHVRADRSKLREQARIAAATAEADRAKREQVAAREAYVERTAPELASIEGRLAELAGIIRGAQVAEEELQRELQNQRRALDREYESRKREALARRDAQYWLDVAQTNYLQRRAEFDGAFELARINIRRSANEARTEYDRLVARQTSLVAATPGAPE